MDWVHSFPLRGVAPSREVFEKGKWGSRQAAKGAKKAATVAPLHPHVT